MYTFLQNFRKKCTLFTKFSKKCNFVKSVTQYYQTNTKIVQGTVYCLSFNFLLDNWIFILYTPFKQRSINNYYIFRASLLFTTHNTTF